MTRDRTSSNEPPPRKRRLRRAAGAAIFLALLLLAIFIVVEVVRRSRFVSDMVVAKVQEATGFLTTVGDMSVGWDGSTVLENVVFKLPLDDQPALTIDRLVVQHDALPLVVLRRRVRIESVHADRPMLFVRERTSPTGEPLGWSLTESKQRLLASLAAREKDGSAPRIPDLTVAEGQVLLAPAAGDQITLPLVLRLRSVNALAMDFDASLGDLLSAQGRLARGGDWTHHARVRIDPSETEWQQVRRVLGAEQVDRPVIAAEWAGRYTRGGLSGALNIDRARSGDLSLAGNLHLTAGESISLVPEAFRVELAGQPPVTAEGGSVVLTGPLVTVRGLALEGADQVVNVDGRADLDEHSGAADLAFRGRVGELFTHEGRATIEVRSPAGRPTIAVTAAATGESPNGRVRSELSLRAAGPDWRHLSGAVEFPDLRYDAGDTEWDVSGLTLAAAMDDTGVSLGSVRMPNAGSSVITGDLRFESLVWSLSARINQWRPLAGGPEFDFGLTGNGQAGAVEAFRIDGGDQDLRFVGTGSFDPAIPKPLSLALELVVDRDEPIEGEQPPPATPDTTASIIPATLSGAITATFTLDGTLKPMALDGEARMLTQSVRFREVVFEDMALLGTAEFREGGGTFSSEEFSILEGKATLVARSDWRGNVRAQASITGVNLETLGAVVALELPIEGRAGAVIEADMPRGRLDATVANARWRIENFAASALRIEQGGGLATYERGIVRLEETSLSNAGGEVRVAAVLPLDNLSRVEASAEADEFALRLGEFLAAISGRTEGTLDLINGVADLSVAGSAGVTLEDQQVAAISVGGRVAGRTLELEKIDGRVGDGTLTGTAVVPLDALAESTARLELKELEPRHFAGLWEHTGDVVGRVNGSLVLAPTTEEHAPEPSRLDIELAVTDGTWRTIGLQSLSVQAYIGARRAMLHRGVAHIGGGSIALWGSTNDHGGERYIQLSGALSNIDLQQIVSAVAPDAERYEGVISGSFAGAGYASDPHRLFGEATLTVTESDLIAVRIINELYSLFSVRATGERNGMGIADMRLDGQTLRILRADYFNRGLELRAALNILDVFAGRDSPIVGIAVGTARPLAGSELSLAGGTDRMLSAAQAGGTVARITGTVGEPDAKVVPLAALQEFIGRVLAPIGE